MIFQGVNGTMKFISMVFVSFLLSSAAAHAAGTLRIQGHAPGNFKVSLGASFKATSGDPLCTFYDPWGGTTEDERTIEVAARPKGDGSFTLEVPLQATLIIDPANICKTKLDSLYFGVEDETAPSTETGQPIGVVGINTEADGSSADIGSVSEIRLQKNVDTSTGSPYVSYDMLINGKAGELYIPNFDTGGNYQYSIDLKLQ
jgi:hypothetical protein